MGAFVLTLFNFGMALSELGNSFLKSFQVRRSFFRISWMFSVSSSADA
jgi:hypothetical protein